MEETVLMLDARLKLLGCKWLSGGHLHNVAVQQTLNLQIQLEGPDLYIYNFTSLLGIFSLQT
jgi:hypothetical protein